MAPTHYQRLGVSPAASTEEIRAAYRARARRLHPDRAAADQAGSSPADSTEMAAVNEAWRVLRDPARRAAYDASLRRPTASAGVARTAPRAPTEPAFHHAGPVTPQVRLLRALPWLIVLAVLAIVFVFTAYARGPGDESPAPDAAASAATVVPAGSVLPIGTCVQVTSDQPVLVPVPCSGRYDYRVAATAELTADCPPATSGWVASGAPYKLCLAER